MKKASGFVLIALGLIVAMNFIVAGPKAFGFGWAAVWLGVIAGCLISGIGCWLLSKWAKS